MAGLSARRLLAAFAVLVTLVASASAQSTGSPPRSPVIVVVDPQAAMQQSKAGIAIRAQHDQYRQKYQNELESSRRSLKDIENELVKQKTILTSDAWQQKARDFDQKVVDFNQRYQRANLAVEKSYRAVMSELGRAFAQVTEEIAGEAGANLVLPIQQVVLHDPGMDITNSVVDRLNKKYPSIVFPAPEIEVDAPQKPSGKPGKK